MNYVREVVVLREALLLMSRALARAENLRRGLVPDYVLRNSDSIRSYFVAEARGSKIIDRLTDERDDGENSGESMNSCPFCNAIVMEIQETYDYIGDTADSIRYYYAECLNCRASGPWSTSYEGAAMLWSRVRPEKPFPGDAVEDVSHEVPSPPVRRPIGYMGDVAGPGCDPTTV